MCVAYPGKVIKVEGDYAQVDFTGVQVRANISMVPVQVGDYVLVHAGMAIQKVAADEGELWTDLFKEIAEAESGENV